MYAKTVITLVLCLSAGYAVAQDDTREEDRKVMREMLAAFVDGLNTQNMDAVLALLDPEVVITYHNAVVTQGHAGAKEYHDRMLKGANAILTDFSTEAAVSAPAVFHGDTAVAYGTTVETYKLAAGLELVLNGKWSTTLQKKDGEWKALAVHFSSNLFDNPLVGKAKRLTWIVGAAGFVAGVVLMFIVGRLRRRGAGA